MAAEGTAVDPRWKRMLQCHSIRTTLIENLKPLQNDLLSRLFRDGLLPDRETIQFIASNGSETASATKLLDVLQKQGVGSFDKFCDALLQANDSLNDLRPLERLLRPGPREDYDPRLDLIDGEQSDDGY